MNPRIWVAALVLAVILGALVVLETSGVITLEAVKRQHAAIAAHYDAHPWRTALLYFLFALAYTTTSAPGGAVLAMLAGAIFGLVLGTVLMSFASAIGATFAFLASRFLFRDAVRRHFGERLRAIDEGMRRDGALYLFTLRLVPLFPFFMVNALMGVTRIRTFTYYWVGQLGMLFGTVIYVNAGTQLAKVQSVEDVLSPGLIASLVALALFSLGARTAVRRLRRRGT